MAIEILENTDIPSTLTMDHARGYILINGKEINLKEVTLNFCHDYRVEISDKDYWDVMFFFAIKNSPKLENEEDTIRDKVEDYLQSKEEISTAEILDKCLRVPLTDKYRKTWEIKVARILKALNWTKRSNGKRRYWIREAPKLPEVLD